MRRGHAILAGGLVAGTLDILYAFLLWGLRGASPVRILQSIASGLLGRAAYQGGAAAAALGGALHYLIACTMAAAYVLAATRIGTLARRPFLWGPLYGLALYGVMNYVVVPLSAFPAPRRPPDPLTWITGLAVHALLVGLPIALFARAASVTPAAPR